MLWTKLQYNYIADIMKCLKFKKKLMAIKNSIVRIYCIVPKEGSYAYCVFHVASWCESYVYLVCNSKQNDALSILSGHNFSFLAISAQPKEKDANSLLKELYLASLHASTDKVFKDFRFLWLLNWKDAMGYWCF